MERLTIEQLKGQKELKLKELESIKGGNAEGCHLCDCANQVAKGQNAADNDIIGLIITVICFFKW